MIKIEQLLPLLKNGWVAMDKDGRWFWYKMKPEIDIEEGWWIGGSQSYLYGAFDIEPAKDWTKSLMRCGDE